MRSAVLLVFVMTIPGTLALATDNCPKDTNLVCHVEGNQTEVFCLNTKDKKIEFGASHPLSGENPNSSAQFEGDVNSELLVTAYDFFTGNSTIQYRLDIRPSVEKQGFFAGELTTATEKTQPTTPAALGCHPLNN